MESRTRPIYLCPHDVLTSMTNPCDGERVASTGDTGIAVYTYKYLENCLEKFNSFLKSMYVLGK